MIQIGITDKIRLFGKRIRQNFWNFEKLREKKLRSVRDRGVNFSEALLLRDAVTFFFNSALTETMHKNLQSATVDRK